MAPNVTGTTTLFLAEAAMCPTSTLTTLRRPSAASIPPKAKVAPTPTATPSASVVGNKTGQPQPYEWKIVWRNVLAFAYLHYAAVRGLYLLLTGQLMWQTFLWTVFLIGTSAMGITAGAHRLWAHRSYKAKWPLRTLLMLFQTLAFQNHIYEWVRDHRVHHKFTDTDADPHNASRGFFFSHMGWLMVRKHPDVRTRGGGVDLSDLQRDPVVMFQKRTYAVLMPLVAFVMPCFVPAKLWGESAWTAWYICSIMRYTLALHGTWCVNSAAHIWGTRPVDKGISPTENSFVAHVAFGEGWHNYHHVFPWDYKAAELGNYKGNLTTSFIDFFARIGWAYDLKTVSREMIDKRVRRTGDGSHASVQRPAEAEEQHKQPRNHHHHNHHHHHNPNEDVWGWGDKDMSQDDILSATIINKDE